MIKLALTALVLFFPLLLMAAEDVAIESATKTLIWPDGTRYVGGVKDGKRTGKGTIFWQDGTRFIGEFKQDMRNGPGTMILPDGTVYSGFFENDELVDSPPENTITAADHPATGTADSVTGETASTRFPGELTKKPQGIATLSASDEPGTAGQQEQAGTTAPMETMFNEQITSLTEAVKDELRETIDLWGAAWSDQNVPQYLSNYSDDFQIPGKLSRKEWEKLRRTRLNRPRYISVDVDYEKFEFVETNVVDVYFEQSYRSNTFSDVTVKVLRLRKEDHAWKILAENSR